MKFDRMFCFGDSITLGCNDSEGLGWPGRLCRGLMKDERNVAIYNLGVNGDTSTHIATRWRREAEVRRRDTTGFMMLFAFGFNDASRPAGGEVQVDLDTSVSNARSILTEAKSLGDILWIGPTPLDETVNPLQTPFESWTMYNADIAVYDNAYTDLAWDIGIDYLSLFSIFSQSVRYQAALNSGDKVHPGDDGYAMIAESIANWDKWREIL